MAIIDLLVKSDSSPRLSADNATVQHQVALLLQGDYAKWAWLSFSAEPPIYSLSIVRCCISNDKQVRLSAGHAMLLILVAH